MIQWLEASGLGARRVTYKLRDWLFSRQRYWGEPFPIVYDEDGLPIALPESMLPVELPEMTDFRPQPQRTRTSDPVPPLARAAGWGERRAGPRRRARGVPARAEHDAAVGRLVLVLPALPRPGQRPAFVDPAVERYWMVPAGRGDAGDGGVDLYVGGVEHAVLHLLYARFWHKVLYDLGHVSTPEPFQRLVNQGNIQADAFIDERGMYVPAADVVRRRRTAARSTGRPVTRRSGQDGQEPEERRQPGRHLRQLRRGHAAAVRDGHGPARRRPALAAPTTSSACTGSCSGCGAPGRRADRRG